jgi:hypothetical protein
MASGNRWRVGFGYKTLKLIRERADNINEISHVPVTLEQEK